MLGRRFNGSPDFLTIAPDGWNALAGGAFTVMMVINRVTVGTDQGLIFGHSGGTPLSGMWLSATNALTWWDGSADRATVNTFGAGLWMLGVQKAAGSATPVSHTYSYAGPPAVMQHQSLAGVSNNIGTVTTVEIGRDAGAAGSNFIGDIFAVAGWNVAITNGGAESLPYDLDAWFARDGLQFFYLLNQGPENPLLSIGPKREQQTAVSGTSLGGVEAPIGFHRRRSGLLTPSRGR